MSIPVEYIDRVRTVWSSQRAEIGYVHPPAVGAVLTNGLNPHLETRIARELYRHETKPFLYDGTERTLETLLQIGDHVCIWTDDYLIRLGTAGFGNLRKRLPDNERKRLFVNSAENKFSRLPGLLQYAQDNSISNAVVVDNSRSNLEKAYSIISSIDAGNVHPLFVQTLQTEDVHARPSTQKYLPGTQIRNITELVDLRRVLAPPDDKTLWIVDFNHTLVDTNSLDESRISSVATVLYKSSGR